MICLRAILLLSFCSVALTGLAGAPAAAPTEEWQIEPLSAGGGVEFDFGTGLARATNGVLVKYGGAVLTANEVSVNQTLGEVVADGDVRIQRDDQLWVGEHIRYNFKTRQMEAEQFRSGKPPVFVAGHGLHAEITNNVYAATNSFVTTDDLAEPAVRIRARYLRIIPGDRVMARDATLYIGQVPVFYFPYYSRTLDPTANHFNFVPGYRTSYGPFLLTTYYWYLNQQIDGALHLDYREKRGFGEGADLNTHLGRWGEGSLKGYYLYDQAPNTSFTNTIPNDRYRINFGYLANPYTNIGVRAQVRYQSDFAVVEEFFPREYLDNPQPSTFVEVNKLWRNFNLDAYVQPRVNNFLETVERLPDVRLTGYRQQIGASPIFYESESSAGYYDRLFPVTNGVPDTTSFAGARLDTYQKLLWPETFFGWLNVTPRIGGRYTYYGQANGPGAFTDETSRGVLDTGAEVSFKASRVWPDIRSKLFDVNGLRHIIEPSVNYSYVPAPLYSGSNALPQFDYQLPSLRLLPVDFPDYNSIDSIGSQNLLRFGVRNKLQTKRAGEIVNLVNWDLYTEWALEPSQSQTNFADVFSDLAVRPFSWLKLESLLRIDTANGDFNLAYNTISLQPNNVWSWSVGQYYLRNQPGAAPAAWGPGYSLISSSFLWRLNENWAFRVYQRYDLVAGKMQDQGYTIYRDFRLWTGALTLRLRNTGSSVEPKDVLVAFTFSLKAFPRFGLGGDAGLPHYLLGD